MKPNLTVVSADRAPTVQQRVEAARDEARQAVAEHLAEMAEAGETLARLAQEVAAGGDLYPAGIRDLANRMGTQTNAALATLQLLAERQRMGR